MLSCQSAQHPPFAEFEYHFGFPQRLRSSRSFATRPAIAQDCAVEFFTRPPLSELDNLHDPLPPNQFEVTSKSMQSSVSAPRRGNYSTPQSHTLAPSSAKDSGLGITTDENCFDDCCGTSTENSQLFAFNDQPHLVSAISQPKLGSPFDGETRNLANTWDEPYPCSTLSEGAATAYVPTPDQSAFHQPDLLLTSQPTLSPANITPYQTSSAYPQQGQFKRPVLRPNSASCTVPQSTFHQSCTPNGELPLFQGTPQSMTSEWQSQTPYLQNHSQVPKAFLDSAACEDMDYSQSQAPVPATMTMAPRPKRHLRPSFSESCVPRMSSPARMRAASMGHFLQTPPYERYMGTTSVPQLPLPPMPPSVLINTPYLPTHPNVLPETPSSIPRHSRSNSSTPQRRKRPSSPPASDFAQQNMPYRAPVKQEPTFAGDLYTPRYKRRTPNGRWEGWCGYCTPGRWLDLKNSRFWEDKLRNHGICAKTKLRFEEPIQIRWVSLDGSVIPEDGLGTDHNDPFLDQRKREGLCGVCRQWIGMDGLRTKAKDRAVGWWMHAYKCHDHDKAFEQQVAQS